MFMAKRSAIGVPLILIPTALDRTSFLTRSGYQTATSAAIHPPSECPTSMGRSNLSSSNRAVRSNQSQEYRVQKHESFAPAHYGNLTTSFPGRYRGDRAKAGQLAGPLQTCEWQCLAR